MLTLFYIIFALFVIVALGYVTVQILLDNYGEAHSYQGLDEHAADALGLQEDTQPLRPPWLVSHDAHGM